MCGIAGYVGPPRVVDTDALVRALAPRGPDGQGVVSTHGSDWHATLVHTRLAIIDPTPAGAQPMGLGQTHSLVFNGEIFNHAELRRELIARGISFHSTSDTEVLLRGLVEFGPAFIDRLRGPFAFAFLDRGSGHVLLGRDRLGVNPLYISRLPRGGHAFASTVNALEAAGLTSGRLDVRGLCGFLFYGSVPEPHTLTRDVTELEPGTWMRIQPDGTTVHQRYWWIPAEDLGKTAFDVAHEVEEALKDAAAAEQVSDVPVAVLLSSGLDSSSVTALVARTAKARVDAFTVGFPSQGAAVDESQLAAETARALGLRHQCVHAYVEQGSVALQDALMAQDLPSIDGVNTYLVSGAIRSAGFKVALSGLGGDELFLGYANRVHFHRLAMLPSVDHGATMGLAAARAARRLGVGAKLERALFALSAPRGLPGAYAAVRTIQGPASVLQVLHPDLRSQLVPEDLDPVSYLDAQHLPVDVDGALSRLELRNYLRNTLLKDSNILSLAHGLELRVPFMDYRLVETVMRIPGRLRAQGLPPKPLLRRAMGSLLPQGVEKRPKIGFVLPLDPWLQAAWHNLPGWPSFIREPIHKGSTLPVRMAVAALRTWQARRTGLHRDSTAREDA